MKLLALLAMAVVPQEADVPSLLKQLSDESIEIREKAMSSLIAKGIAIEDQVRAFLPGAPEEAKARCEEILKRFTRIRLVNKKVPPIRTVTLQCKDKPLKEVMEAFERQAGWPVRLPEVMHRSITLDLKDSTPFEALDAICEQAKADFRIDHWFDESAKCKNTSGIWDESRNRAPQVRVLTAIDSRRPLQLKSRYAVALSGLHIERSTDFEYRSSKAEVGLDLLVPPDVTPDYTTRFHIDSIVADTGAILYDRSKAGAFGSHFSSHLNPLRGKLQIQYEDSKVRAFASIKGKAVVQHLLSEKILTFDSPEESVGDRKSLGDGDFQLSRWSTGREGLSFNINVFSSRFEGLMREDREPTKFQGLATRDVCIRTTDGARWKTSDIVGAQPGGKWFWQFTFPSFASEVTAVEIAVDRECHSEEFSFEFKDIPLP